MKQISFPFYKKLNLLLLTLIISLVSFAQEKKVDIDINAKGDKGGTFSQPWVWIVGAAVFIIILVALLRGRK
jgi:hypothetical protein